MSSSFQILNRCESGKFNPRQDLNLGSKHAPIRTRSESGPSRTRTLSEPGWCPALSKSRTAANPAPLIPRRNQFKVSILDPTISDSGILKITDPRTRQNWPKKALFWGVEIWPKFDKFSRKFDTFVPNCFNQLSSKANQLNHPNANHFS